MIRRLCRRSCSRCRIGTPSESLQVRATNINPNQNNTLHKTQQPHRCMKTPAVDRSTRASRNQSRAGYRYSDRLYKIMNSPIHKLSIVVTTSAQTISRRHPVKDWLSCNARSRYFSKRNSESSLPLTNSPPNSYRIVLLLSYQKSKWTGSFSRSEGSRKTNPLLIDLPSSMTSSKRTKKSTEPLNSSKRKSRSSKDLSHKNYSSRTT